ncbi:MAG: hypothetical protein V3W14_11170 [Candidatus Neomarinimicrobiota bacterium]
MPGLLADWNGYRFINGTAVGAFGRISGNRWTLTNTANFGAHGKKSIARSGFRDYYFKVENDGFMEVSLEWVF